MEDDDCIIIGEKRGSIPPPIDLTYDSDDDNLHHKKKQKIKKTSAAGASAAGAADVENEDILAINQLILKQIRDNGGIQINDTNNSTWRMIFKRDCNRYVNVRKTCNLNSEIIGQIFDSCDIIVKNICLINNKRWLKITYSSLKKYMYSPTTELKDVKFGSIINYIGNCDTRVYGWCCVDWNNCKLFENINTKVFCNLNTEIYNKFDVYQTIPPNININDFIGRIKVNNEEIVYNGPYLVDNIIYNNENNLDWIVINKKNFNNEVELSSYYGDLLYIKCKNNDFENREWNFENEDQIHQKEQEERARLQKEQEERERQLLREKEEIERLQKDGDQGHKLYVL